jgi:hypothetical protein
VEELLKNKKTTEEDSGFAQEESMSAEAASAQEESNLDSPMSMFLNVMNDHLQIGAFDDTDDIIFPSPMEISNVESEETRATAGEKPDLSQNSEVSERITEDTERVSSNASPPYLVPDPNGEELGTDGYADSSATENSSFFSSSMSSSDPFSPKSEKKYKIVVGGDFAFDANTQKEEYETLTEIMRELGLCDAATRYDTVESWDGICNEDSFKRSGITFFHDQDVQRPERRDLVFTDADIRYCRPHNSFRESKGKKGVFKRGICSDHCPVRVTLSAA